MQVIIEHQRRSYVQQKIELFLKCAKTPPPLVEVLIRPPVFSVSLPSHGPNLATVAAVSPGNMPSAKRTLSH
jgi:hypothetical protein